MSMILPTLATPRVPQVWPLPDRLEGLATIAHLDSLRKLEWDIKIHEKSNHPDS